MSKGAETRDRGACGAPAASDGADPWEVFASARIELAGLRVLRVERRAAFLAGLFDALGVIPILEGKP